MRNLEIPTWLKHMPLAPEYRPTETEFADPIAYISKIEDEASAFGICKVIPPFRKPTKRYVHSNLNKSLSKSPVSGSYSATSGSKINGGEVCALFTTRQQELGRSLRRLAPLSTCQSGAYMQVWESGEFYTLDQFESKAKYFARNRLQGLKKISPLGVETLFWETASGDPIYVEYANDVPGSGFGQPEEPFHNLHKGKRKRHNHRIFDYGKREIGNDQSSEGEKGGNIPSNTVSRISKDITAGWELSNSPWNLQVIAKASGSLSRFMPDDIPGVTTPMVYIGMLFSWFAWHVEDHELHSLNFLHTGSPKTWYGVPKEFAFPLEDIVRVNTYNGNVDRLAALSFLGEKTTLLSPETIVASGIPCCRLVQYPGEFVVTFPRAYHIGFSHGFNVGEAANFATPQWLKVAKEAAVRRAAMGYLPMLSHQQLLYALSMSLVSRIPTHLPGPRSSRLKDRRKEENESLVKKAFIDELLKENHLLDAILRKNSNFYAVLWNPDMLPAPANESSNVLADSKDKDELETSVINTKKTSSVNVTSWEREYLDQANYIHIDDDNSPCGFHADSGALACVACGVLGFPFMSILQPSNYAFQEIFSIGEANDLAKGRLAADMSLSYVNSGPEQTAIAGKSMGSPMYICIPEEQHVATNLWESQNWALKGINIDRRCRKGKMFKPSAYSMEKLLEDAKGQHNDDKMKWNTSHTFMRPRIFCLEHAFEIERLLECRGGANMLVICHSDYLKIEEKAISIAKEIDVYLKGFHKTLITACQTDLDLICIAIDDDADYKEDRDDWTSRLGLNLKHSVKTCKSSPFQEVKLLLPLGGVFFDHAPCLRLLSSRQVPQKCRTSHKKKCTSISEGFHKKNQIIELFYRDTNLPRRSDDESCYPLRGGCPVAVQALPVLGSEMQRENQLMKITTTEGNNAEVSPELGNLPRPDMSVIEKSDYQLDIITTGRAEKRIIYVTAEMASLAVSCASSDRRQNTQLLKDLHLDGSVLQRCNAEVTVHKKQKVDVKDETSNYIKVYLEPSNTDGKMLEVACDSLMLGDVTYAGSRRVWQDPFDGDEPRKKVMTVYTRKRRKREDENQAKALLNSGGFIRSPCEGLRPRRGKTSEARADIGQPVVK